MDLPPANNGQPRAVSAAAATPATPDAVRSICETVSKNDQSVHVELCGIRYLIMRRHVVGLIGVFTVTLQATERDRLSVCLVDCLLKFFFFSAAATPNFNLASLPAPLRY